MIKKLLLAFAVTLTIACELAYAADPIVYSRCVRYGAPQTFTADVPFNGIMESRTRTFIGMDVYDVMPDVANFFTGFTAPCDMVYRDASGVETVIYNCSSNTGEGVTSCAAFEPTVSFDAKKITFAVFRGDLVKTREGNIQNQVLDHAADPGIALAPVFLDNLKLDAEGAHLVTYDLETQQLSESPYEAGVWDSGPTYLSNGKIAFTSTRQGNQTQEVFLTTTFALATKIYTVDPDWKNVVSIADFSVSQQQHPIQLKKGTIAYSWWRTGGAKAFKYGNGGPGSADTIHNLFDVFEMNPDGSGNFALYGVHSGDHNHSHIGDPHDATHFFAQTGDEWIWSADYYRRNNNGLGYIVGFLPEPEGQEGMHPSENPNNIGDWYMVRNAIKFNSWSSNNDSPSFIMPDPSYTHPSYADPLPYAGKVGHPGALPNNGLMLSWGKGLCSIVGKPDVFTALGLDIPPVTSGNGSGVLMNILTSLNIDTPGCDIGIYKATVIPSTHPSDLEMIVDSPDWHEIMARAVVPYSAIHGVEKPAVIPPAHTLVTHPELPPGTPYGLFGAASITDRETHPQVDVHYQNSAIGRKAFALQGTDTKIYTDDEMCGIRLLATYPNMDPQFHKLTDSVAGERVAILGEHKIDNRDVNGNPIIDPSGHVDTSFLVSVPANVPHFLQAIDCQGRTLNFDQHWQIVTAGEKKTCGGCHVHSKPTRITFEQSYANTENYVIPRLGRGIVPLIDGTTINSYGWQIEFTQDIKPIFDQHCVSCHGGSSPAAGLALDNTSGGLNREKDSTWWCLVYDRKRTCSGEGTDQQGAPLHRPQLNNYVRAFSAIGSKLYWKAANQRTDGFADEDHPNDIDFGLDHPHTPTITAQELGLISRWIDIGAPGGPGEVMDTQNPTLNIVATTANDTITGFHIGTTDVGSGVDTSTAVLTVGGTNIPISLANDNVTSVTLASPISDQDSEIVISVEDMSGNMTLLRRTGGFFLSLPATAPTYIEIPIYNDQGIETGQTVKVRLNLSGSTPVYDPRGRDTGQRVGVVVTNE